MLKLQLNIKDVSIPYRLATNQNNGTDFYPELEVSIPYRLATNDSLHQYVLSFFEKFQFLIGWLQTFYQGLFDFYMCLVSIPYRLATNFRKCR